MGPGTRWECLAPTGKFPANNLDDSAIYTYALPEKHDTPFQNPLKMTPFHIHLPPRKPTPRMFLSPP